MSNLICAKNNFQENNLENLLQTGFDTINQAFDLNKNYYESKLKELSRTINDYLNKETLFKEEIDMLKRENSYYKKLNDILKNENNSLKLSIHSSNNENKTYSNEEDEKNFIFDNNKINNNNNENLQTNEDIDLLLNKNPLTERKEKNDFKYNNNYNKNNSTLNIKRNSNYFSLYNNDKYKLNNNNNIKNNYSNDFNFYSKKSSNNYNNFYKKNNSSKNLFDHNFNNNYKKQKIETKIIPLKKNYSSIYNISSLINDDIRENKFDNNKTPIRTFNKANTERINRYNDNLIDDYINNKNMKDSLFLSPNFKQSETVSNFLKECQIYLTPNNFEKIVKIFQDYKNGTIDEENVVNNTKLLLSENKNLINLFESNFMYETN